MFTSCFLAIGKEISKWNPLTTASTIIFMYSAGVLAWSIKLNCLLYQIFELNWSLMFWFFGKYASTNGWNVFPLSVLNLIDVLLGALILKFCFILELNIPKWCVESRLGFSIPFLKYTVSFTWEKETEIQINKRKERLFFMR